MADSKQLNILKNGVQAWNDWRRKNPAVIPDLTSADLREASLNGINLLRADLSWATLSGADLMGAILRDACLGKAHLSGANLTRAILRRADLGEADLLGVEFNRADLTGADLEHSWMGGTVLANVDLSNVKGLETVHHAGASEIGVGTIYMSRGTIPEAFLRGAGVPDNFIAFMHSLTSRAIEFYSCFISYSSKDHELAERLHTDLQNKGVRCWFAPHDLKIGEKLRPALDDAIRLHDKLMVLLSKNSVKSSWVEKEIETAFEKEHRRHKAVLFPIQLDDAIKRTKQAWAADIRRTRHIGDFRNWKDHDSYKKAFERLLRNLKSEAKVKSATQNC